MGRLGEERGNGGWIVGRVSGSHRREGWSASPQVQTGAGRKPPKGHSVLRQSGGCHALARDAPPESRVRRTGWLVAERIEWRRDLGWAALTAFL